MSQLDLYKFSGNFCTELSYPHINHSLAEHDMPCLDKHGRSGSALFVIKYVNFYQKQGSSNLVGWKLGVDMAS